MTIERIKDLAFWSGPVTVEPLTGGITNRNYVVTLGAERFVARICSDRRILGIDRRSELVCQRLSASMGIAPKVLHEEPGILISEYLPARTMSAHEAREPSFLSRLGRRLRDLHSAWDQLTGEIIYFCPFQTVRTYVSHAQRLGGRLPPNITELADDARLLSHELAPFRPTLCHNDLLAANLLDDGKEIWLVDWEYSGIGHPLFDIASVSGNCGLSDEEERLLLEAYLGCSPSGAAIREVQILKSVSLLREALWAILQQLTADINFDYARYAADNFSAYKRARNELRPIR